MDIILKPLGWILKVCSQLFGNNYVWAILFFAVVVEILMLPFAIKQQKNSIKQASLRPKEAAIRKKYAGRDDKPTQQKMAMEIQEMYQKEGYNPMGGCLPMLIQMVLLFALYGVVVDPLKYICGLSTDAVNQIMQITGATASNTGTMGLLEIINNMGYEAFANVEGFTQEMFNNMPRLQLFGIFDFSQSPSSLLNLEAMKDAANWLIILIPIMTFAAYFFSMKITRKLTYQPMNDAQQAQMGCSTKVMDFVMPLFSVFLAFGVPAALGFYWIIKSLLGVVKQVIIYYTMPIPKLTEEDYKKAEKEVAVRTEKNEKITKSGRVVRSLHHIDDEDFEDTAEAGRRRREALEAQEAEEKAMQDALKATAKKSSLLGGAKLKDESDKAESKKTEDSTKDDTDDSTGDYRKDFKDKLNKKSKTENKK